MNRIRNEREYLTLLSTLLKADEREDRTCTGTRSIFGTRMEFDVSSSFPLLTTKKMHIPSIVHELLWFISGSSSTEYLTEHNVTIWNEWSVNDTVGPLYGVQWRNWNGIDQLQTVIDNIYTNPNSRRHIISAWNVQYLPDETKSPLRNVLDGKMALAPCHAFMQFYVSGDSLSLQLYQRSADIFLGVPYNIASYTILLYMVAKLTNKRPHKFIWVGGDTHLYSNHIEQAKEQLRRTPYLAPRLSVDDVSSIDDFTIDHINISDYNYHPAIRAPISV